MDLQPLGKLLSHLFHDINLCVNSTDLDIELLLKLVFFRNLGRQKFRQKVAKAARLVVPRQLY